MPSDLNSMLSVGVPVGAISYWPVDHRSVFALRKDVSGVERS